MPAIGRNDPCPCGSGKKYKHCCSGKPVASAPAVAKAPPVNLESIESLEKGLAQDPGQPEWRYKLAALYVRQRGDHRQALTLLEGVTPQKAQGISPQELWVLRGECLKQLNELPDAVRAYQEAVRCELAALKSRGGQPSPDGMPFFHLGRALLLARDFVQAEASARQGLKHFAHRWQLYEILAMALHKQGRTAEAVDVYRQAMRQLQGLPFPSAQLTRIASIYGSTLAYIQHGAPPPASEDSMPVEPRADGGWATQPVPELHSTLRTIERRDRLSPEEFLAEYARKNRPVLLTGLLEDWPAWEAWTKSSLLQRYGDHRVQVRRSSDVTDDNNQGGRQRPRMPLRDYIAQAMGQAASSDRDPLYLFGLESFAGVERDYRHPPQFAGSTFAFDEAQRQAKALFYIGPAYSGVSFHQHTAAWNALFFGYKRWFLLPPFHFYGPTSIAMHEWASTHRSRFAADLHECVQQPGEILFVPQYWYHAVLNVSDCVGVAVELGPHLELMQHQFGSAPAA
ncbi:MAG: cupin-like domain-containing protein [Myxococcaceae bacterium]|nr:cupin-like domain-containing protein [Myxococcaceae bacterium]